MKWIYCGLHGSLSGIDRINMFYRVSGFWESVEWLAGRSARVNHCYLSPWSTEFRRISTHPSHLLAQLEFSNDFGFQKLFRNHICWRRKTTVGQCVWLQCFLGGNNLTVYIEGQVHGQGRRSFADVDVVFLFCAMIPYVSPDVCICRRPLMQVPVSMWAVKVHHLSSWSRSVSKFSWIHSLNRKRKRRFAC